MRAGRHGRVGKPRPNARKKRKARFVALAREYENAPHECPGCGQEIDPAHCYCGDEDTGQAHDGHYFTPMGCECYRRGNPEDLDWREYF